MWRRPIPHGIPIIVAGCSYELVALIPGSPVPTISTLVRRRRSLGVLLLLALTHHLLLEEHS